MQELCNKLKERGIGLKKVVNKNNLKVLKFWKTPIQLK